jgi:hypothetical protein
MEPIVVLHFLFYLHATSHLAARSFGLWRALSFRCSCAFLVGRFEDEVVSGGRGSESPPGEMCRGLLSIDI